MNMQEDNGQSYSDQASDTTAPAPTAVQPQVAPTAATDTYTPTEHTASAGTSAQTPSPSATAALPQRPVSTRLRVSTLVWGLVIVALGALVLAIGLGARMDMGLVTISVLAGAGLLLIVGSIVSAAVKKQR